MTRPSRTGDAAIRTRSPGSTSTSRNRSRSRRWPASRACRGGRSPGASPRRPGRRPIDYVHALRIERARQLIEAGAGSIDDVGYQVGYEDLAFFRRLFRRTTGVTPAAYRRKYAPIAAPRRNAARPAAHPPDGRGPPEPTRLVSDLPSG